MKLTTQQHSAITTAFTTLRRILGEHNRGEENPLVEPVIKKDGSITIRVMDLIITIAPDPTQEEERFQHFCRERRRHK